MGCLGVGFAIGGGLGKIPPPPVWKSLGSSYELVIWYISTHPYLVLQNISFSNRTSLILPMSAFLAIVVPLLKEKVWELCFNVAVFHLSGLVTGPNFLSISFLVPELWQFSFIRDWPEIWKLEIPLYELCPISED